jgi:hypothetical protein
MNENENENETPKKNEKNENENENENFRPSLAEKTEKVILLQNCLEDSCVWWRLVGGWTSENEVGWLGE